MEIDKRTVIVRRVGNNDIDKMVRHRLAYLSEMQGKREMEYMENLSMELTAFFQSGISEGSFMALVAEANGAILGYGAMILKHVPGDLNKSSYLEGEILNMYTLPQYRKQGVSTLILRELIQLAKSAGISKVALHTSKEGEHLYRTAGFSDPIFPYLEKQL